LTTVDVSEPPGLLLVDDHAIVREGLKRVLAPIAGEWSLHEASSGFEALDCLRRQPIALTVVDLSMPGMTGLELIHRIRGEFSSVKILVLSMQAEDQYALRAFKAGADGYVSKDSAATTLVAAVRKVAAGGTYVSATLAERLVRQLNTASEKPLHAGLTDRELDVLQRIVSGQRLTEIAADLHLSVKTVSTHKARIQDKLQLPNTAGLIRYGLEHDLGAGAANPRIEGE
jgi:DNA-binding NarL/FixJ family response regulator